jgi:phosphoribosyl 1,2-cyclic phosphodiesterase
MKVISLQSGSNGNCIYVEANSVTLLFDAGISASDVQERLALHGRDASAVDAVLISHDHIDHCRSMGILNRTFGLPIYATAETYEAAKRFSLGEINDLRYFVAGKTLQFGKVTVETISTPHDGADGVVFVVDDGKHRLGIMTDLGHVFDGLGDVIASLDAELLLAFASKRMKWACLGHLSHDTNTPEVALETHRKILGDRLPLFLATRYEVSDVMEL